MEALLHATNAYKSLLADARAGRSAHAVLVAFPDGAYLRPLLRECAKAFFLAGEREARLIENGSYSDCVFLPEEGGKFTVEACERVLEESTLRPVEGKKKLFVLDAFQNATALVQNKLLKVLEEPPDGVYFLIGTTNPHAVLPTVRSRTELLTEPPFPEEEVARALRRMHPDSAGADEAAAACGGVFSTAEKLLSGGGESFRLAERFLSGEDVERLCRELNDKTDKQAFFAAIRQVLRDMLFQKEGQGKYAARKGAETARLAREYPAGAIVEALALTDRAERETVFNANLSQCALALAIGIGKEKERWQRLS